MAEVEAEKGNYEPYGIKERDNFKYLSINGRSSNKEEAEKVKAEKTLPKNEEDAENKKMRISKKNKETIQNDFKSSLVGSGDKKMNVIRYNIESSKQLPKDFVLNNRRSIGTDERIFEMNPILFANYLKEHGGKVPLKNTNAMRHYGKNEEDDLELERKKQLELEEQEKERQRQLELEELERQKQLEELERKRQLELEELERQKRLEFEELERQRKLGLLDKNKRRLACKDLNLILEGIINDIYCDLPPSDIVYKKNAIVLKILSEKDRETVILALRTFIDEEIYKNRYFILLGKVYDELVLNKATEEKENEFLLREYFKSLMNKYNLNEKRTSMKSVVPE